MKVFILETFDTITKLWEEVEVAAENEDEAIKFFLEKREREQHIIASITQKKKGG